MRSQNLDLRYPETYLRESRTDCSAEQLRQAIRLGKDYRELKKILKHDIESKKRLSKEFVDNSGIHEWQDAHAERVKIADEKIKRTKLKLKKLEKSIRELLASDDEEEKLLPPQFSGEKICDVLINSVIDITELNASNTKGWCEYVNSHPGSSVYHSLSIKNVIEKTFHHSTMYLIATNDNGSICGVLPLVHLKSRLFGDYWCSVPFFNYGGVLSDNNSIQRKLVDHAWKKILPTKSRYIEYRQCREIPGMPVRTTKVSMILKLPRQKDLLWQNLGTKLRAQINKATTHKQYVKIGKEDLVNDFYRIFSRNMRDLGTPIYSKNLFVNMLEEVPTSNIIVLYVENRAVSAGFLVGWKNTLEVPWASTLREANKYNSNMLLYWYILKFAISENYEFFDFGRSSENSTTHKFKKQWGASQYQLYWHYSKSEQTEVPDLTTNNPKYKMAIKLWQHLPVWITNMAGPHIVKYIS